jgi:HlyD family secretion protein
MTVEVTSVVRAPVSEQLTVVGNLIGAQTVEVVSKVSGRLQQVAVRIGDRVSRGQLLAQVEDSEIREQVKQAEASYQVSQATIRQREADLKFAETSLARSQNLFSRQLIPQQTLDDSEARQQAAMAQLDLARAQFEQAKARLEELRITLANTRILSPVDGFVGRRNVDSGTYVSPNVPVASVVDIKFVRMVANLVERDLRRVAAGAPAEVDVDAFPGEIFKGRVARVAPVLDPATRTATMEIEVPNGDYRLKPGMYARVRLTVDQRQNALVVPRNALVDVEGKRGVYIYDAAAKKAHFRDVSVGLQDDQRAEITSGLSQSDRVVTTGAAALRTGDTVLLADKGGSPGGGGGGQAGNRGASGGTFGSGTGTATATSAPGPR